MKEQIKRELQLVRAHLDTITVKGEDVIHLGYSMQAIDRVLGEVDKLQEPAEQVVQDDG